MSAGRAPLALVSAVVVVALAAVAWALLGSDGDSAAPLDLTVPPQAPVADLDPSPLTGDAPAPGGVVAPTAARPLADQERTSIGGQRVFEGGVRFEGLVLDARTGAPLADAVVRVRLRAEQDWTEGGTERTGEDGRFQLTHRGDGARGVEAEAEGYALARVDDPDPREDLVFALQPLGRIEGRVMGARRSPRLELKVGLWTTWDLPRGRDPLLEVPLGETGAFAIEDLAAGTYALGVIAPYGVLDAATGVVVEPGHPTSVELVRPEVSQLIGRMELGPNRSGLGGVRIRWWLVSQGVGESYQKARSSEIVTGPDGAFVLDDLPPGEVLLEAFLPWSGMLRRRARLTPPRTELTWRVDEAVELHGRVVEADGTLAAGVHVGAEPTGRFGRLDALDSLRLAGELGEPFARARTDERGRFRLQQMPGGSTSVVAVADDGSLRYAQLHLGRGQLTGGEVELRLPAPHTLRGRVVSPEGDPIDGAEVSLRVPFGESWIESFARPVRSDAEGRFELLVGAASALRVAAEHPDFGQRRVNVAAGTTQEVEVVLDRVHALFGTVVDEDGRVVPGAGVRVGQDRRGRRFVACDDFGHFRVPAISEGVAQLVPYGPGHRHTGALKVRVPEESAGPLRLVLRRQAPPEPVTVEGEIVLEATQAPVPGLRFDNLRGAAVSLEGTRFRITGLRPGRMNLVARAAGFEPVALGPVQLEPGAEHDAGRHEIRGTSNLRVRVSAGGKAVEGAVVRLRRLPVDRGGRPRGQNAYAAEPTRRKGEYRRENLPRYRWTLEVRHPRYRTHREEVRPNQRNHTVRVRLQPKG